MAQLPLWKEAYVLREQYRARGVEYCYNQRTKRVFLSVLAAPQFVPNVDYCQMVGHLILDGGVIASRKIDENCEQLKREYLRQWGDNPDLAHYADTIKT